MSTPDVQQLVGIELTINGRKVRCRVEPRLLLVELLREELRLTGTHIGCDTSYCGACTVQVDGAAVKSCTLLAVQADGREVLTVEGLEVDGKLHPLQQAFSEHHALQCGYCTPGMLMSAHAMLENSMRELKRPDRGMIRKAIAGNVCRCTGYQNIMKAVESAVTALDGDVQWK